MKHPRPNSIDHIVYCTPELGKGMEDIYQLTGITPIYGGKHLTKGTHNALIKIGTNSYFEILAPDPENEDIPSPRWMGIDLIDSPKITRWAIKTRDIEAQALILAEYKEGYGSINEGSRALSDDSMLQWKLTDPLSYPEVEVVPFLLDWMDSSHPTTQLPQECRLTNIGLFHTHPGSVHKVLQLLDLEMTASSYPTHRIEITLDTPKGEVTIF